MNLEISPNAAKTFLLEFKKKAICPKERASIIRQVRMARGMSQRALAKEIGIPHSTLQDWELWNKIDQKQIDRALKAGFNMTDIYKSLRDNHELKRIHREKNVLDNTLRQANTDLRYFINKPRQSPKTIQYAKDLINTINRILMRIDK